MNLDISRVIKGEKVAVADALNFVTNSNVGNSKAIKDIIKIFSEKARIRRHVIGITGPPGVGKSTLISKLISKYRAQNKTVGVIAVDPSSRRSGGSLLGDRARLTYDINDPFIFIRSMAAGSHLGGLAWKTRHCLTVFEAVYDIIIIETVGVGQSETEIEQTADTIVFVVQPGSGDSLQFMKAGIIEIPDIIVINKSDEKRLAAKAYNDLKAVCSFYSANNNVWNPELIMTSAIENHGINDLVSLLEKHFDFIMNNNILGKRADNRIQWIYMLFKERYGSYGIDTLGGEAAVLRLILYTDIMNPLECMEALAKKM